MNRLSCVAACIIVLGIASITSATPITFPPSLTPGTQYRLAFVTSTGRDSLSNNIADYNTFVTGVATGVTELNALGTSWSAIASAGGVSARTNTSTTGTGVAIFLLDGTMLADNYLDLWDGTVDHSINVDQSGNAINGYRQIWTGTNSSGNINTGDPNAGGGLGIANGFNDSFNGAGEINGAGPTNAQWIECCIINPSASLSMYAMSDVLTQPNPVPEPATVGLLGVGVAGLVVYRRSRKRR